MNPIPSTNLEQLATLVAQQPSIASDVTTVKFWQNLAESTSDTFNFFQSYCSRTGRNIGALNADAIHQLLEVASLICANDTDDMLVFLQDACILHMRPAPAWQRVTEESIQQLATMDPTGAACFLLSKCFGYESPSFRQHDRLYVIRRNTWLIETFAQLSTPVYQLHIKPLLRLLIQINGNVGLAHLRKLDKWTVDSGLPEPTQLVDHLRRELSIMNGNWKHTARNPNPYMRQMHESDDSMFSRAYRELETRTTRKELEQEFLKVHTPKTQAAKRKIEDAALLGDLFDGDGLAPIPTTLELARVQQLPPRATAPVITITTRGKTTQVSGLRQEQSTKRAKAPKPTPIPRSAAEIARRNDSVRASLSNLFKKA